MQKSVVCSMASFSNSTSKQSTSQFRIELGNKSSVKLMNVLVLWLEMTVENP